MSQDLGRGGPGPVPPVEAGGLQERAADGSDGAPLLERGRGVAWAAPSQPAEPPAGGPAWAAPAGAAPDVTPTRIKSVEPPPVGGPAWAAPASAAPAWAAPAGAAPDDAPPVGGPTAWARGGSAAPPSLLGRPGGIPLRPLDIGDILDSTFGTIRRNPRTMIGLSALLVTLQQMLALAAEVGTGDIPTMYGVFSDRASLQAVGGVGAVVSLVLSTVVSAVLTGMVVVVVSEDILQRRVDLRDVWRRVRPRLWALVAASLVAGVLPFSGLVFLLLPGGVPLTLITLVVPGALLWGAWALTTPALILERLGPIRALRRSWRLSLRSFWRVWGIRTLSVLLGWVMQGLLLLPFTALGAVIAAALGSGGDDPLPLAALACVVVGSILGGMIAQPFLAGVVALLYIDRRMRAEGLDIVLHQRGRTARRTSAGSGGPAADLPSAATLIGSGRGL